MAMAGGFVFECAFSHVKLKTFNTRGKRINRVGIFIGNDTVIHFSLSRGVTEDCLQETYFDKRFAGAVRVIDGIVPDMSDLSYRQSRSVTSVGKRFRTAAFQYSFLTKSSGLTLVP